MLDPVLSKQRQQRLCDLIRGSGVDAVVISQPHHVYYLTGHLPAWRHLPALVLTDDRAILISANSPAKNVAADDVRSYPANLSGTLRQDQPQVVAALVADCLQNKKRIGFDASETAAVLMQGREGVCVDETLWQMRRAKDADELALMQQAIDATEAMYRRARQIIEPGVSEIEVFNQLHAVAVESTGERMTALLGNDFACGAGGGLPRAGRVAEAGELYILDLGPTYRGYFADNARVFSVDGKLTDAQHRAWETIVGVFPVVESLSRPGAACRDIFNAIDGYYQERIGRKQFHHLGHGVGLQAHEFPHLNPHWDDRLIEGEIFTCEPGIYGPELHAGIRIENQYLVTKTGVRNLTPFSIQMI